MFFKRQNLLIKKRINTVSVQIIGDRAMSYYKEIQLGRRGKTKSSEKCRLIQ